MVVPLTSTELVPNGAPNQIAEVKYVDLYFLVPHLLGLYPAWKVEDILGFVVEKTHHSVHPEDQITLRAIYQRCLKLRSEFEGQ